MKKVFLVFLGLLGFLTFLKAEDVVQIVTNGTVGANAVVISNQKVDVSTLTVTQIISSGTVSIGTPTVSAQLLVNGPNIPKFPIFSVRFGTTTIFEMVNGTISVNWSIIPLTVNQVALGDTNNRFDKAFITNDTTIGGRILLGTGNAGSPGYTYSGATNSGFFRSGSSVAVTISATQVAAFTSTGIATYGGYGINTSTLTIGNNNLIFSTANANQFQGSVIAVGSGTLATGASMTVTVPNVSNTWLPMVTEVATDAEANQVNISALTATTFTIKNKSAINPKDFHYWVIAR